MPWMDPKDGNHAWAHEWRPWLEAINIKAMGGAQDEGRGWKLWMKAMDQKPKWRTGWRPWIDVVSWMSWGDFKILE